MKTFKLFSLLAAFFLLSAFNYKDGQPILGSYGVSTNDPAQIKLTLKEDGSFTYQDLSNPKQKILVNGTYTQKGNKVILKSTENTVSFHHIWTIKQDGSTAKSRKGLCFYKLCKI